MRMEVFEAYGRKKLEPYFEIGSRTSIGQNFHVVSADTLLIGNDVTISGNVFITTASHDYMEKDRHILDQELKTGKTIIGDFSFIGYGACIMAGVKLGRQNIVGANSVVLKGEYPDYCVLAGAPAKIIRKMNLQTGIWEKI